MGKKGRSKTAKKKAVKKAAAKKGKKVGIKTATKIAKQADKQGIDVASLADSVFASVPFVGPLVSEVAGQAGITEGIAALAGQPSAGGAPSGRGGRRGVMMVDASTGLNLGSISRKKALGVLTRRKQFRRSKKVVLVPAGQEVRVI